MTAAFQPAPRAAEAALRQCLALARRHYENFPVASVLLPRRLRRAVAAIYAFARMADDLADEGDLPPHVRLAALDEMECTLEAAARGEPPPHASVFVALSIAFAEHGLPLGPFRDLLSAFRQDAAGPVRFEDYGALAGYCRRSASPIGRLLLHLHGVRDPRALARSDAICTALQLVNFVQDLAGDLARDRIYIPLDELDRFGVREADLKARLTGPALAALLAHQLDRAARLLEAGAPLAQELPWRAGLELRLVLAGARRMIERLRARPPEALYARPTLGPADWALAVLRHARA